MKTYQTFQYRVPFLGVVMPPSSVDDFKKTLSMFAGRIKDEYDPQARGDGKHYFQVEETSRVFLNYLLEKPESFSVTRYALCVSNDIRVLFDSDHRGVPKFIEVNFLSGKNKDGEDRWRTVVEVRGRTMQILDKDFSHYELNWASIGAVSVEYAEQFAKALSLAVALAKECEEQFCHPENQGVKNEGR